MNNMLQSQDSMWSEDIFDKYPPHLIDLGAKRTVALRDTAAEGPVVILVHGNSLSSRSFGFQFDSPLSRHYRLISLDLPGHGDSPRAADPERDYTIKGYADIIKRLVEKLNVPEVILGGNSLGGHIVVEAMADLESVVGITLWGTPLLCSPDSLEQGYIPPPSVSAFLKARPSKEEVLALFQNIAEKSPAIRDILVDDFLRRTDERAREVLGNSVANGEFIDEVELISRRKIPVAIFHGTVDPFVSGSYIHSLMLPLLWRGCIQLFPTVGHYLQIEEPQLFNQRLDAFLKDMFWEQ
ncbi:alpha/beta fold hydrolase [candidate division CSSED10-310 bacterium]|uniref:Alpha/beta fold hydrolase n=1 Tax=candidate division CSSED10-310 bacterium TaxID=2855610 RepID=A0ABV6YR51_UNCC1